MAELMDLARERGFDTDSALAARLGKSKQLASQWRSGVKFPEDDTIIDLAKLAGEDAGKWLVRIQAERSTGAAARAWNDLAKRLAAAAACVMVAAGMALPHSAQAHESPVFKAISAPMYIMSSRFRRWLRAVFTPASTACAALA